MDRSTYLSNVFGPNERTQGCFYTAKVTFVITMKLRRLEPRRPENGAQGVVLVSS